MNKKFFELPLEKQEQIISSICGAGRNAGMRCI